MYHIEELAKDINNENPPAISSGFSGITLAYNAKSVEEVDKVLKSAKLAGAKIIKEPKGVQPRYVFKWVINWILFL